ncbi:uncharacterized protein LOC141855816 isoform X2 [Brevipalpus obovatus]|uniref:uncharacterized protein LOC141855816 isoform X2 n=1 Tax=Brevipalpus obovatus TaxID=246614 RepID=UPI003D9E7634
MRQVERMVNKAFQKSDNGSTDMGPMPLSEKQYFAYLDSEGRIKSINDLRISVYYRGVDPSLRRAVWKHLLSVFPPELTGQQRFEYIKHKTEVYHTLKTVWQSHLSHPLVESTLNMVRKDVLRTDRTHPFYEGDGNPNVISLLNILTTFALNHGVKYCQGMSDLASPLLYAMKDEAHAYMCFCALMLRMRENFSVDGEAITRKFEQLSLLLQYYDPDFYAYLKQIGAQDLIFCYRWILLELKREFALDDALHMLEVLWSSIPALKIDDLPLYEEEYKFVPDSFKNLQNCNFTTGSSQANGVEELPDHFESLSMASSFTVTSRELPDHCHRHRNHEKYIPIRKAYSNYLAHNFKTLNHSLPEYESKVFNSGEVLGSDTPNKLKSLFTLGESAPASGQELISSSYLNKARRHLRSIRFLPKILSNDSCEIDSPDADDFNKNFSFPPKFIDKGTSLEEDDTRRTSSLESVGFGKQSFDAEVESDASNDRVSERRRKFSRRESTEAKERRTVNGKDTRKQSETELVVHCNGEFDQSLSYEGPQDWVIPQGLARSASFECLKNLNSLENQVNHRNESLESQHSSLQYLEKERSEGYVSGPDPSDLPSSNFGLISSHSTSSSCSSLVILNSNGSIIDLTCTSRLKISLPSPSQIGSDTVFMLFLSLTLLLQHRDKVLSSKLDANEVAIYFDGYIRRHNVYSVLESGRHLFHCYLSHWHVSLEELISNQLPSPAKLVEHFASRGSEPISVNGRSSACV